ncbi:DUF4865 family protein [Streptomyces beijiangensis]|uniref:DUF4865 family protein n=1 Tax=Streptomyces beijiangensis TaxID=163361 RepID=A0A939FCZ0_9ACTN|nr:DUF4865 family protein [Streptomyces beijiangensis]MBO0516981.1 DUF4865 family protein [Streptomyces beijiangensis]
MHAMQYEITLPADYDMEIIRKRVAAKGHLLDDFPGLGIKAYLMRERGEDSPVNQYAPFYLWNAPEGMNAFLWGPGFQGVANDFGRPEVQHWTGLAYEEGLAAGAAPRNAVRRKQRIPEGGDLAAVIDEAVRETQRLARIHGVVCAALAVDPRHWELVHLTLWEGSPKAVGDRFEVLHLCEPERAALGRGRQW